jgi:hypothetical protein
VSTSKAQVQSFAVAAVGTGFNLYDFVFSHKETKVYSESRYSMSTQSKNKVQNSPGSHA